MGSPDDVPGSGSDRTVERGETYNHADHGEVEVTGIWKGIEEVDKARHLDEKSVIIVRYTAEINGELVDELTETLDEFLRATE